MKKIAAVEATEKVQELRRRAYLDSRGINPKGPHQLEFWPDNVRVIPNDYARSSLFTARSKTKPRENFTQATLFHYQKDVVVIFSGIELRAADDELVWLQILNYAKHHPLGSPFEFSVRQLCKDIGWSLNGRYYDIARECISRLKASEIMVINDKAFGKGAAVSLIDKYAFTNGRDAKPTQYRVWIDPNLIILFAGNTFTYHQWEKYRRLSPIARRLADYVESHKHPHPLKLDTFNRMCGSDCDRRKKWAEMVRDACAEIKEIGVIVAGGVKDDDIWFERG